MELFKEAAEHAEAVMASEGDVSIQLLLECTGVRILGSMPGRFKAYHWTVGWLSIEAAVVNPIITEIDKAVLELKS